MPKKAEIKPNPKDLSHLKHNKSLLLGYLLIASLTAAAVINARLRLFGLPGDFGLFYTALSFLFVPAHVAAMTLTNQVDPPALWGVLVGYCLQGLVFAIFLRSLSRR